MNEVIWILKKFDELNSIELYTILQLRNEVFVVEQNCPYQDADNKDQLSYHLMGITDDKLIAYTRLVPPGIAFKEPSIGRVVTSPSIRKKGIGKALMEESIKRSLILFGVQPIKIGAQLYLEKFYTTLGFQTTSDTYLEDNIPHVEMIRP